MFHINIHCKPTENNIEYYGKYLGAYAVILIDYKDIDGAFELAKFYVSDNQWEIIEVEEEYFYFEEKEQLVEEYKKYFDEIAEYGYSMIFNTYDTKDD